MNRPQLLHKPDFARAQTAWDALWDHAIIRRPCTLVTARKRSDARWYSRAIALGDDFEPVLRECDDFLESHAFLGESMPAFRPGFGPDQMAAFAGAKLVLRRADGTSWSDKAVRDWRDVMPLAIAPDNPYWRRMQEFHAAAAKHLADRCLLAEIDMHSNVDLLEGLRGAQDLLFDMIDHPETVLAVMAQARDLYRQVYETLRAYGSKAELGTTSALPFYHGGRFNRVQADFIALLSPDLFRRFVLPALEEEIHYLDRSCFHLDGPDALRHLDELLAIPRLDAIQWVPGAGQRPAHEWPEVLHRIQRAGKIVILHVAASTVRRIHGQFDPTLLVYDVVTESVADGLALLEWLEENT